ncbi:transcriptional regulator [Lonsdalea britannica]|uniref:ArsR family transcriptional regulator n=1 Tax=Lonsdalea britannica TaxID=1082704 RepID=A0AAD0WKN5_9GAMM|nr:metalloregulator ArsR/SmtB family transcription factor [Lonsdalea britannica]AXW86583.1 ArsR family transcriptional regulator [Lonsdalea britannica]OSM98654.1 transcriptional regulator [Lonsdalea britannica]OSN09776.1 transcriptional regulator [Lonsdalea britannica]
MQTEPQLQEVLHALANRHRLMIIRWLADPKAHFPIQRDGDLTEDGVCVSFITDKTGLSQPTVTTHMQVLAKAGLVIPTRIKNWVYYRLNDAVAEQFLGELGALLRRS